MLRNVAGPHVQSWTDDAKKLVTGGAGAGCLKILNTSMSTDIVREFHQRNPTSPVACRYVAGDSLAEVDRRTSEALRIFEPLLSIVGDSDLLFIEVPINEAYQAGEELKYHSDAVIRCGHRIRQAGARPIGFNFSVGNPSNLSELHFIEPGAQALVEYDGAIGYHNYSVPGNWLSEWYDLRHRKMRAYLPPATQFFLGEGFIDHGIIDGRLAGWRDGSFRLDGASASRLLRLQAQEISKDSDVIGWTPFGAGAYSDWLSFEYADEPYLCQVFKELYEVSMAVAHSVGAGLRKMIPYLGQPIENEVYHFPGTPLETSLAVFENGTATWHKAANQTVGIRSDGAIFSDRGNHGDGTTVWQVQ